MDSPVQLVFFGEVLNGFKRDEVEREVGRMLKIDEGRAARLFSGKRRVIKRSLSRKDAERYARHLARFGALVHIEPMGPAPGKAAAARVPAGRRSRRHRRRLLAAGLAALGVVAAVGWVVLRDRPDALAPDMEATARQLAAEPASAFRAGYAAAAPHKAFAASPGGSWGWIAGMSSVDDAMLRALADCDAKRAPDAAPCDVVDTR